MGCYTQPISPNGKNSMKYYVSDKTIKALKKGMPFCDVYMPREKTDTRKRAIDIAILTNCHACSEEFVLEEKQYMDKLQNALAKLTDAQRVTFLMNRIEGKKHKEIAELLGISTKAVEKRIYGALKKLREDISEL
jgi:RNA polymerase sigma factor (sigma-70 family)